MTALDEKTHTQDAQRDETVATVDVRAPAEPAADAQADSLMIGATPAQDVAPAADPVLLDMTADIAAAELHPEEAPAAEPVSVALDDTLMVTQDEPVAERSAEPDLANVTEGMVGVELRAEPTPHDVQQLDEQTNVAPIAPAAPITEADIVGVVVAPAAPDDAAALIEQLGRAARAATAQLALAPSEQKNRALREAARALRAKQDEILAANARDLDAASGLTPALRDRLLLNADRIEAMARGLVTVAGLPDPIGTVLAEWTRPNGLHIQRVRVPLGVIGIIYESRPNVTADAGALCLKAGNAAILRGGSESFHSSNAIAACLAEGLIAAGLPHAAIQLVPTTDRVAVGAMLAAPDLIDVIVPRGGRSLIERVQRESRVPVFAHLEGINHVYVDAAADLDKARAIVMNAKLRRVSVCGAMETLLVDRQVAGTHLPPILQDLLDAGCEVRGDETVRAADPRVREASEQDWSTEYLEAILSVRVVDGLDEAIRHINHYGSHHTDAIVTEDESAAAEFLARIDSGIVLVNASTQFADGGEFGMGAEIGISTGKLHARGPVGAEQLTSYKYLVRGNGQVRP